MTVSYLGEPLAQYDTETGETTVSSKAETEGLEAVIHQLFRLIHTNHTGSVSSGESGYPLFIISVN